MASEATSNKGTASKSTEYDIKSKSKKQGKKHFNQKFWNNFGKQNKAVPGEIEKLGNNVYFYHNYRQGDNFDMVTKRIFGYIRKTMEYGDNIIQALRTGKILVSTRCWLESQM